MLFVGNLRVSQLFYFGPQECHVGGRAYLLCQNCRPGRCGAQGHHLSGCRDKPFGIAIDWESVSVAEVDVAVADRPDALESVDGISRRRAFGFAIDRSLQSLGVPGHYAIRDEREGSGGGDQLLGSPSAPCWQRLSTDLPL